MHLHLHAKKPLHSHLLELALAFELALAHHNPSLTLTFPRVDTGSLFTSISIWSSCSTVMMAGGGNWERGMDINEWSAERQTATFDLLATQALLLLCGAIPVMV
jgi:hypothetical protein